MLMELDVFEDYDSVSLYGEMPEWLNLNWAVSKTVIRKFAFLSLHKQGNWQTLIEHFFSFILNYNTVVINGSQFDIALAFILTF
jgi:hypothetical protein